jgi:hypothetical protein
LGAAIARLVTDAGLRHALGATGRVVVETRFAAGAAQARLARELEALAEKNEVARCA